MSLGVPVPERRSLGTAGTTYGLRSRVNQEYSGVPVAHLSGSPVFRWRSTSRSEERYTTGLWDLKGSEVSRGKTTCLRFLFTFSE